MDNFGDNFSFISETYFSIFFLSSLFSETFLKNSPMPEMGHSVAEVMGQF